MKTDTPFSGSPGIIVPATPGLEGSTRAIIHTNSQPSGQYFLGEPERIQYLVRHVYITCCLVHLTQSPLQHLGHSTALLRILLRVKQAVLQKIGIQCNDTLVIFSVNADLKLAVQ